MDVVIIGLSGHIGSGKSEFAKFTQDYFTNRGIPTFRTPLASFLKAQTYYYTLLSKKDEVNFIRYLIREHFYPDFPKNYFSLGYIDNYENITKGSAFSTLRNMVHELTGRIFTFMEIFPDTTKLILSDNYKRYSDDTTLNPGVFNLFDKAAEHLYTALQYRFSKDEELSKHKFYNLRKFYQMYGTDIVRNNINSYSWILLTLFLMRSEISKITIDPSVVIFIVEDIRFENEFVSFNVLSNSDVSNIDLFSGLRLSVENIYFIPFFIESNKHEKYDFNKGIYNHESEQYGFIQKYKDHYYIAENDYTEESKHVFALFINDAFYDKTGKALFKKAYSL